MPNASRVTVAAFLLVCSQAVRGGETSPQCKPRFELDSQWGVMRLRPHENAFLQCTLSEEQTVDLVRAALVEAAGDATVYRSLFIGRLVEYPWLSEHLAKRALDSSGWDAEHGRPRSGEINRFVAAILTDATILERIQRAFAGSRYRVSGASVEKVLVGDVREVTSVRDRSPARVPYDALVHFVLANAR